RESIHCIRLIFGRFIEEMSFRRTQNLIVLSLSLEVSLRMCAYRAYLRSLIAFVDVSAVVAFPAKRCIVFKGVAFAIVIEQSLITSLMSGLYFSYAAEFCSQFSESFCFSFFCHT